MKKINFASTLMVLLLIFFGIYNTYFGWNQLPVSEKEKLFDLIFEKGMYLALIIYFLPIFDAYERLIRKIERGDWGGRPKKEETDKQT